MSSMATTECVYYSYRSTQLRLRIASMDTMTDDPLRFESILVYSILLNIPIITIQWPSCHRLLLIPTSLILLPSLSPLLLIIDTSLLLVTSPLILCLRPILRLQSLRLQLSPLLQLSADTNCYFRFGSTTTPSDSGPILCGYRSLFPYCSYCFGLLFVGLSSSMRIDSDSSSCFGRLQYQGRFNGYFNSS